MNDLVRRQFAELVGDAGDPLSDQLDVGALLIAATIDSSVDVDGQRNRLDRIADQSSASDLESLSRFLATDVGLSGVTSDYYAKQNSNIVAVLDSGVGIPITLAVVLIEIGRRRGISVAGVSMPAHFLVRSGEEFVDLFHGPELLSRAGCEALFVRLTGRHIGLGSGILEPVGTRDILKRMIANLRHLAAESDPNLFADVCGLATCFPDAGWRDHAHYGAALAKGHRELEGAAALDAAAALAPEERAQDLERRASELRARFN